MLDYHAAYFKGATSDEYEYALDLAGLRLGT